MTSINSTSSSLSQIYAAAQKALAESQANSQSGSAAAAQNSSASGASAFGNATNVTLSPAARTIVASQTASSGSGVSSGSGNSSSNSTQSNGKAVRSGGGGGGGGGPISTSTTTSDTETLIEEALREVIPKVGIADASEVVDSKGNIDQVKLQELINQQNQTSAPVRTSLSA